MIPFFITSSFFPERFGRSLAHVVDNAYLAQKNAAHLVTLDRSGMWQLDDKNRSAFFAPIIT
jgi:hypothetical protein